MNILGIFSGLRPQELIIILLIVLVLFGAKKLPEIGRGMGKGIKEFKEGVKDVGDDVKDGLNDDEPSKDRTATASRDPEGPSGT